jgi:hypothetical protein
MLAFAHMLALLVVEVEPSADTALGFGHSRVGIEVGE